MTTNSLGLNATPGRLLPPPNGLELSCPAEAGKTAVILAHKGGPSASPFAPARRVSFSELLGAERCRSQPDPQRFRKFETEELAYKEHSGGDDESTDWTKEVVAD